MNIDEFAAKGHQIITDSMALAKAAEAATTRNQAVSTHIESCLRALWDLLIHSDELDGPERAEDAATALTQAGAALLAEQSTGAAAVPGLQAEQPAPAVVPADPDKVDTFRTDASPATGDAGDAAA